MIDDTHFLELSARLGVASQAEASAAQALDNARNTLDTLLKEARAEGATWREIAAATNLDERALQYRHANGATASEKQDELSMSERIVEQYRSDPASIPQVIPFQHARSYLRVSSQLFSRLRRAGYLHAVQDRGISASSLRSVDRFLESTISIEEAAKSWGVSRTTVDHWIRSRRVALALFPGEVVHTESDSAAPGRIDLAELESVRSVIDAERKRDEDPTLLTDQQVAQLAGVSRPAVFYAVQRGALLRDPSGRIRLSEAERWSVTRTR